MTDTRQSNITGTLDLPPLRAPRIVVPRRRGRFFGRSPWLSLGGAAVVLSLIVGVLFLGGEV